MQGRIAEKEKLINLILGNEAKERISIIPIVGLGGIGKTTLARSIWADKRFNIFDIQAWVHVSEKFDLLKIARTIIRSVDTDINLDGTTLHLLQNIVQVKLTGKRYLIILDDFWEEDGEKLEVLKDMLKHGSEGSRIIVTTRNQRVVETMSTGVLANQKVILPVVKPNQINLGTLETSYCWELMKVRALSPYDGSTHLEKIGYEIASKCGGVPLVANALGKVMSEDKSTMAWQNILVKLVDLGLRSEGQQQTVELLKLSYYFMKMDFKICFAYLAAFPKGCIIDTNRLIQQWKALGYIYSEHDGESCINYLLGMSFLQISGPPSASPSPVHGNASRELTMHDLVHDLASIIIGGEFLVLNADHTIPRTWKKAIHSRHAELIHYENRSNVFKNLPKKLRSLHIRDGRKWQLPPNAFSQSNYMRVLDLACTDAQLPEGQSTSSKIRLPRSLRKMKLLRYLDATGLPVSSLSKSVRTLQNLETLIMSNCSLETLPDNVCSLHKLCYLDLSGNRSLYKLPMSLGKLSKLSFLNISRCSVLQELPKSVYHLTLLQHLDMSQCCAIQNLPSKFGDLPNLLFLSLSGCSKITNLPNSFGSLSKLLFLNVSGCSKLTKLPDRLNLQYLNHLDISRCYELENLPQDLGNLKNLVFLDLSDCYKVSVLPESFCDLSHLKVLCLSDCHELKELPNCFADLSVLESLNLTSCSKLQVLPESLCKLHNLRDLNVSYCTSLKKLPTSLCNLTLHILDISCAVALRGLPNGIDTMTSLTQFEFMKVNDTMWEMAQAIRENLKLPRTIHIVQITESRSCSSIVDLVHLTCHDLQIVKLQNVKDPEDAERARLRDKSDLRLLSLKWGYIEEDIPVIGQEAFISSYMHEKRPHGEEDKRVLERLIPPRTLEKFFLQGYLSPDFPSWMSDISSYLPSLTILGICGLRECDTLAPFGRLPNLRSLYLSGSAKNTRIDGNFYGDGGTCAKLRVIVLSFMANLEEWWTTQSGTENEKFLIPNLHSLSLIDCPKLKFLPYPPRSMHLHLQKSDESLPEGGFGDLRSSVDPFEMEIRDCNFSPNKWRGLQHFATLEILIVDSCVGLRVLLECLWQLTSLRELSLILCPNLTYVPENIRNLTALRKLHIERCPILLERFQGEDAHKISHIQEVTLQR